VAFADQGCYHDGHRDDIRSRHRAAEKVGWRHPHWKKDRVESVRLFAINDFHGNLSQGRLVAGRPVGGAAVLAAYFEAEADGREDRTFFVHAGDHVGASPPVSALLQDEPAIEFLNLLANRHCRDWRGRDEHCNIIGTLGNHEFDEGRDELLRLLRGGNHPSGPFLAAKWRGARFPYVNANVVDEKSGRPIIAPYVIRFVKNTPIAFIGAVLQQTPTIVTPTGVAGLEFRDEAEAINKAARELRRQGIHAMVVLIHQGTFQTSFEGETPDTAAAPLSGPIVDIVQNLDSDIDVVVSGHTHSFTNAFIPNKAGKEMLVTQAFSYGTAFGEIDLDIDRRTRDITAMTGRIVTTWADSEPGLHPNPRVAALVAAAEATVAPLTQRIVGTLDSGITRAQNAAGESALGNLIADAQRDALRSDFAFMNPGGIRDDLNAGDITWGELFAIQPFNNDCVLMTLTGSQIKTLLEQQWQGQTSPRLLQISGLSYAWQDSRPVGDKVVWIRRGGVDLVATDSYTVTVNSFIAAGGDNFLVLKDGIDRVIGPVDIDALVKYIETRSPPLHVGVEGRIERVE